MSGSSKVMLRVMAPLPWVHALLLGGRHRCGGQEVVVQPSPAEGIERHRAEPRLLDEDALLAAVRAIPALADSDAPSWEQEESWEDAYRLLAAADVIGERGRVAAVVPVFERVARGDL
jgi:hypothetical protein